MPIHDCKVLKSREAIVLASATPECNRVSASAWMRWKRLRHVAPAWQ